MARGESQGLQIAVILLTMCVVGLAVSTWVYFQSTDTAIKAKEAAETATKAANDAKNVEAYKRTVYQFIVGDPAVSEEDILKTKQAANNATDAAAEGHLDTYKKVIANHDKAYPEGAKSKPLIELPGYLITGLGVKNEQIKDVQAREETLKGEVKTTEDREQGRTKTAEAGMQTATADLAKEREKFNEERTKFKKDMDVLTAQIETLRTELKAQKEKSNKDLAALALAKSQLEKDVDDLGVKVIKLQKDGPSFETPDGQITWINQRQRLCWIDVGHADGLTRQATFSVYDHDENGVSSAKRKARIEVVRVVEAHLAECRILEDEIKNPILPGDKIFTPAWSPGQRLHFALAGMLDMDDDGAADNEKIRSIIELNGGVVDAEVRHDGTVIGEVTNQTRYLIRGKAPSEREFTAEKGKKAFNDYSEIQDKAKTYGVEIIDVTRFLGLMGWKAQERTTRIGPKRTAPKPEAAGTAPKAKPAATDEEPAEDADAEEKPTVKPPVEDDPFK